MELTPANIELIKRDIKERGVTLNDLADSLVDHICCRIENSRETDFETAYAKAMAEFGDQGPEKIQRETIFLLILKKEIAMKKTMYLLGYLAAFLFTTGLLFKVQHWPGAAVILTLGVVLLNFGFLPMYFYDRYKQAAG